MKNTKILFCWSALPVYAARQIDYLQCVHGIECFVVTTKPSVPIRNIEHHFSGEIRIVGKGESPSLEDLFGERFEIPSILFLGGYRKKEFKRIRNYFANIKCPIVLLSDHTFERNWYKKIYDTLLHKIYLSSRVVSILVPGKAGWKWATRNGYKGKIYTGLYGADSEIFMNSKALALREKTIIFIGQFIQRKGVLNLMDAFIKLQPEFEQWKLKIVGNGLLKEEIYLKASENKNIVVYDFMDSTELSEILNDSRVLALPSSSENWGLVVHEATLCGCALLLSEQVGAAYDLADTVNSELIVSNNPSNIAEALIRFYEMKDEEWQSIENKSLYLSAKFGPDGFSKAVLKIIDDIKLNQNIC